jgi:trans-aconitate methyltransferase
MKTKISDMTNEWNAALYDENHAFVSRFGEDLIGLLAPQPGENILDLGCGTGDLAYQISQTGAAVIGIDNSAAMISHASVKYPALTFHTADATAVSFNNEFDAVFSNAALHWMRPPAVVLQNIWRALKPAGRLVAEFGGKDNVGAIQKAIVAAVQEQNCQLAIKDFPWYLPSLGEYTTLMESCGFRVNYAIYFDRPTKLAGAEGLRNWITMFSNNLMLSIPPEIRMRIIERTEELLRPILWQDGNWVADYKRLRIVADKE